MAENNENGQKTPKTDVSRETFVTPYEKTIAEKNNEVRTAASLYLFTDEERQRGNEASQETNRMKGEVTQLLEDIDKNYKKLVELLEKTDTAKAMAQKLYVQSIWFKYKNRLINSLVDLATGVCYGVVPDPDDKEKKLRVYQEKPSIYAHKLLLEYLKIETIDEKKSRKKTAGDENTGEVKFEDL